MTDYFTGLVGITISAIFFGINFLPVKKYNTYDGIFFQHMLCTGILCVGIIVQIYRQSVFYSSVLWGGFIWCTGNLTVVPTIQCIGLSLGMLIWGGTNLLTGWAVGYFGLFGITKQTPKNDYLNVMGVVLCFSALSLMFFVKPNEDINAAAAITAKGTTTQNKVHKSPSASSTSSLGASSGNNPFDLESPSNNRQSLLSASTNDTDPLLHEDGDGNKIHPSQLSWTNKLHPSTRRVVGAALALVGGVCYGTCMVPAQYSMDMRFGSSDGIDYVFSHFIGIFLSSTFYFISYCALQNNMPVINKQIALPGFCSGVLWAIAQTAFFIANDQLKFVVTFPILGTVPGALATLVGILLYNEISGKRNFQIIGVSLATTSLGCLFIALSTILG